MPQRKIPQDALLYYIALGSSRSYDLFASDFRSNGTFPNFTDTAPESGVFRDVRVRRFFVSDAGNDCYDPGPPTATSPPLVKQVLGCSAVRCRP